MSDQETKCKLHSPEELAEYEKAAETAAKAAADAEAAARAAEDQVGEKFADDPESEDAKKARSEARSATENAVLAKAAKTAALEQTKKNVQGAQQLWTQAQAAAHAALTAAGKKADDDAAFEEVFQGIQSEIESNAPTKRWTAKELGDLALAKAKGETPPENPDPGGPDPADIPGGEPGGGDPEDAATKKALSRYRPAAGEEDKDWMRGDFGIPTLDDNGSPIEAIPEARTMSRALDGIFRVMAADEAKKKGKPVEKADGGVRDAVTMMTPDEVRQQLR